MAININVCVFINGVAFTPCAVTYTARRGGDESFSVTVPSIPSWDLLPVRSHGAVFYTDPVDRTWRFLCEGEYVGDSKQKSAAASRTRTLQFMSLFSYLSRNQFVNMFDAAQALNATTISTAIINDLNLSFEGDTGLSPSPVSQLLDKAQTGDIATFYPSVLRQMTHQLPVEAYYYETRKLNTQIKVLPDADIGEVLTVELHKALTKSSMGWATVGPPPGTNLDGWLKYLEALAMYQRVPCPNSFDSTQMYLPDLFSTVPPPCNVIFSDQMNTFGVERDLINLPTRTIVKYAPIETASPIPILIVHNDGAVSNQKTETLASAVHGGYLSARELLQGVVTNLAIDATLSTAITKKGGDVPALLKAYTEYQHQRSQGGGYTTAHIGCVFLPYVLPGFPIMVEEATAPFIGMVDELTHTFNNTSSPATSVRISYVRPLKVNNESVFPPVLNWVNSRFAPDNLMATYKYMFGGASTYPVYPTDPTAVIDYTETGIKVLRPDTALETALAYVIPLVQYDNAGRVVGMSTNTVAQALRESDDIPIAMYEYQYRRGMDLQDYWSARGQTYAGSTEGIAEVLNVYPSVPEFFGAPSNLIKTVVSTTTPSSTTGTTQGGIINTFTGDTPGLTKYGVYELAPSSTSPAAIDLSRRTITENIKAALATGITYII